MLCKAHYEKMLSKLKRLENTLNPYLFIKIESLPARAFRCNKQFHNIPDDENFDEISKGFKWGSDGEYCWIKAEYTVPEELDGKDLFLMPRLGGYEAMLWVNGVPFGTFNNKITYTSHGNHYCGLIKKNAKGNEKIELAIEYYAGHDYHGCDPFSADLTQINTKISLSEWSFILFVWVLHCIFFFVSCTWKRHKGIYTWSLQTRDLFCSGYLSTVKIVWYKWNTLCSTDCGRTFSYCYNFYGITASQRTHCNRSTDLY